MVEWTEAGCACAVEEAAHIDETVVSAAGNGTDTLARCFGAPGAEPGGIARPGNVGAMT
jgi:hypothetical protein